MCKRSNPFSRRSLIGRKLYLKAEGYWSKQRERDSSVFGFEGVMSSIICLFFMSEACGPVAQLVRAPPCHGGGRRFEPDLGRYSCKYSMNIKSCACNLVILHLWGLSSAGRASALQAEGHRFEPYRPHIYKNG